MTMAAIVGPWTILSSVLFVFLCQHTLSVSGQGFEYNVACPPPQRPSYASQNGCILVMYGGDMAANITINSASQLWFKLLAPGERYEFEVDPSYLVSSGTEEKRLRIRSSNEISILVQKLDFQYTSDRFVGATEVYERRFSGYEFYPLSRPVGCTSTAYTNMYYTIVPSEEKTRVAMYQDDVYIDALLLEEYMVFTESRTSLFDFSTYHIYTDAPVIVFAGCACLDYIDDGSYISAVPPIALYGTQFFAPPLRSASSVSEYAIRILASEDLTIVTTDNINEVLNRGGILDTVANSDEAVTIQCSKPCLAAQFSRSVSSSAEFGNFQFNLIDQGRFYMSAVFSTLHYTSSNSISITVFGEGPYLGLTLDGVSLDGGAWVTEGEYGYLTRAVTQGGHRMESEDLPFTVYVYGHTSYYGGGYGFEVRLHGDYVPQTTPEPTVPTTPEGVESYEYSAICVPSHYQTNTAYTDCTLVIATGEEVAQVTMTNLETTWDFEVNPGVPFILTMDRVYQLTSGVEEKRLKIVSNKELMVTTTKEDGQYGDRYLETSVWPEKRAAGNEFYILQGDSGRNGCTSSSYRKAFYGFAAYEPATFIEVYDGDDLDSVWLLGQYSSYSRFTTTTATDWTGLRVHATKPIAVISGTLCNTDSSSGTYLASLPPISAYGQEFVVPSIAGPSVSARYAVRILAAEDSTVVVQDEVNYPLNQGETLMLDYDTILGTNVITCSKNCLAVFFQRATANNIGHFMTRLIPTEQFYTARHFVTSDLSITHYLTVIVNGLPPINDVLLDGDSLEGLVWGTRGGYSVARVEVARGQHYIEATGERGFGAYVYGHTESYGGGYGYAI